MKPNYYLVVANWKMQLAFNEAIKYVQNNHKSLIELAQKSKHRTILCPSFPALFPLKQLLNNSKIFLGAQNCSPFRSGAYTGQVAAESLAQIGCHYCIVGHSECRQYNHESNTEISNKVQRLLEQNIQPIICIGENKKEYEEKITLSILERQLRPVMEIITNYQNTQLPIYVAYEPVWSIGTGIIPSIDYLNEILTWIHDYAYTILGKNRIFGLLYGGSISNKNIAKFEAIPTINGFLVGGSSIDFQKFNNIVNSL